jgi:hypothetical protein
MSTADKLVAASAAQRSLRHDGDLVAAARELIPGAAAQVLVELELHASESRGTGT